MKAIPKIECNCCRSTLVVDARDIKTIYSSKGYERNVRCFICGTDTTIYRRKTKTNKNTDSEEVDRPSNKS